MRMVLAAGSSGVCVASETEFDRNATQMRIIFNNATPPPTRTPTAPTSPRRPPPLSLGYSRQTVLRHASDNSCSLLVFVSDVRFSGRFYLFISQTTSRCRLSDGNNVMVPICDIRWLRTPGNVSAFRIE